MTKDEVLWRAINPQNWPSIRITIPAASIMILPSFGNPTTPQDILHLALPHARAAWLPKLKALLYLIKVVVLPQALTAGSLWTLLRYLLKDADLLDAQRDRLGRRDEISIDDRTHRDDLSLAAQTSVHMLPCAHSCDIEKIAVSRDGTTTVTVGLDNSIALWRFASVQGTGTREMLRLSDSMESSTIMAIAVDPKGDYVAAATRNGSLQIWRIGRADASKALAPIVVPRDSALVGMSFDSTSHDPDDPFRAPPVPTDSSSGDSPPVTLIYSNGTINAVTDASTMVTLHDPRGPHERARLLRTDNADETAVLITGAYDQRLVRSSDQWQPVSLGSHSTPGDRVTAISPLRQFAQDVRFLVIGWQSGLVEVFDTSNGELTVSIGQAQHLAGITRVDVVNPSSTRCTGCGTTSKDGFVVISSSGDQVYVDRIIPPNTPVCRCSGPRRSLDESTRPQLSNNDLQPTRARSTDSLVVPPCSARAKLSPSSSPRKSPSLLPPTSNGEFPLSSHGTRKLSAYQSHETNSTSTPTSAHHDRIPTAAASLGFGSTAYDPLEQPWTDMEVLPLGSVWAPSGNWSIVGDTIMGLRRSSSGIGHDQWQIWTIDLSAPYNGTKLNVDTSSLAHLEEDTQATLYENTREPDGGISTNTQRTERLHSLSGRATFPSYRGSFSVPTFPKLAYVDIQTMVNKGQDSVIAAFGNQLGILIPPLRRRKPVREIGGTNGLMLGASVQRTPRSRLGSSSGMISSGLGLTPPPPRKVSEDRKAI